jgi:hypothetical protein
MTDYYEPKQSNISCENCQHTTLSSSGRRLEEWFSLPCLFCERNKTNGRKEFMKQIRVYSSLKLYYDNSQYESKSHLILA